MTEFEAYLEKVKPTVEHLVRCRISSSADGDDVLGEIYLAAWQGYEKLADRTKFKPWLISIAQHKIKDYYAEKARLYSIPIDECEIEDTVGFYERETRMDVRATLEKLNSRDQQILYLYYLRGYAQKDIAVKLDIPVGTVKSRLYSARKRFIDEYGEERLKVRNNMEKTVKNCENVKFPKICPEYRITEKDGEIFEVVCEEIPELLTVPRIGEKCSYALYTEPHKEINHTYHNEGIRNARVHDIDCVLVREKVTFWDGSEDEGRDLFIKLTDSHCLYVAAMWLQEDGSLEVKTFLQDGWEPVFGVGDNNCGRETHQRVNGYVVRNEDGSLTVDDAVVSHDKTDLIGRYEVDIYGRKHDTVAMLSMMSKGIAVIQYLNRDGRTVLLRHFLKNNRGYQHYNKLWTEMLPDSERMTINGETYVHYYDCVPDHVITE